MRLGRHNIIKNGIVFIACLLLVITSVSAADFDNVKSYDDSVALGKITINNWFGLTKLAEYTLTKNTYECLTDCYSEGEVVIYSEDVLFDKLDFLDNRNEITNIKAYKLFVETTEEYSEDSPIYKEVCETDINQTICNNVIIDYEKIVKYNTYWKEYNGEILKEGSYKWRLEGKKKPRERVDWIPTAYGKELTEWAWWNTNWNFKKPITIQGGTATLYNFTVFLNIEKIKMQDDFDDLRFLDSSDTNEIKCELEGYNSTTANVWCRIPTLNTGANTIYMYYNNSGAASGWDSANTWNFGSGATFSQIYHMTVGNVSTSDAAGNYPYGNFLSDPITVTGVFGNATEFDGNDLYKINQNLFTNKFTLLAWVNTTTQNGDDIVVGANAGGGGADIGDWKGFVYDNANTKMQYHVEDASSVLTDDFTPIPTGKWWFLGLTYDGTNTHAFINGTDLGATAVANGIANFHTIGGWLDGDYTASPHAWAYWNGRIDELWFINNTVLSAATIERYFNQSDFSLVSFGTEESSPQISVNVTYPINNTNFTVNTVDVNFSIELFGAATVSECWYSNDTFSVNTSLTCGQNVTSVIWSEGSHNVRVYANTSGASSETSTDSVYFYIDSTAPIINVTAPLVVNYHKGYNNLTINWSITEVNPATCLGSLDNGKNNFTLVCNDRNISRNISSYTNNSFMLWANDTFGFSSITTRTWEYKLFENSINYSTPTLEGSVESFRLNITTGSSYDISRATFYYNETSRGDSTLSINGDEYIISKTLTIPSVSSAANHSFFWEITTSDGFKTNTTRTNQSVYNLGIGTCGGLYNVTFLNATLKDEDTQNIINGIAYNTTIAIDINIYSNGSTTPIIEYSNNFTKINNSVVCLERDLASSNFDAEILITYTGDEYATEHYNIQDYNLVNSTLPIVLNLYDLKSSRATTFKLTYKDEDFLAVGNALIQIQRKYVEEGASKIVEVPMTSTKGETVASLVVNDIIYTFTIIKNGVILGTFSDIRAECQNPTLETCQLNFNSYATSISTEDYTTADDLSFLWAYDSALRKVSVTFSIPSDIPSIMDLNITKYDSSNTLVNSTTLTSSAGIMSCVVPASSGNGTFIAKLYRDGEFVAFKQIKIERTPSALYGGSLVFLGLFMFLTLIGVGLGTNPLISGFFLIIGMILAVMLNLTSGVGGWYGASATILWFIIAILLIIIKGSQRST